MSYKLFIDDERFPVHPEWMIARSSSEAIKMVEMYGFPIEISFDHDLGGEDTSIKFIKWVFDNLVFDNLVNDEFKLPRGFKYYVHSQNPVGEQNIRGKMDALIKHYKEDCDFTANSHAK